MMNVDSQASTLTPSRAVKRRSISDTASSRLAPSPNFREPRPSANDPSNHHLPTSKDDNELSTNSPQTPRRPDDFLGRGLSLQMPPRTMDAAGPNNRNNTNANAQAAPSSLHRAPLSPQPLDPIVSFASPATSLPRHSRGLDFSRACTNLHHTTIADTQSSPDSSPTITQRGMGLGMGMGMGMSSGMGAGMGMSMGMGIPSRKASSGSMMLDSPNLGPGSTWPSLGNMERSAVSSSVGSVNMLGSDSGSSDSDDDDPMDPDDVDDAIFTTPQVHKLNNPSAPTPFASHNASPGGGGVWSNNFSPAAASLMKNYQRSRLKKGRSRKSSSSASGHSAVPSPRTTSPPPLRSIEGGGYFGWPRLGSARRESLALGTDQLNISSSNDSGDESGPANPSTPGVVRRAVTRRGNLLPKTKGFARIRAALLEESTPVDTDTRREAETIRQVRERDDNLDLDRHSVAASSPGLLPTVPGGADALEDIPEDASMGMDHASSSSNTVRGPGGPNMSFNLHATKNSAGLPFWTKFDKDLRTPPPPPSFPPRGSSSLSGDINMDSPAGANGETLTRTASGVSIATTDDQSQQQTSHLQQQQQQHHAQAHMNSGNSGTDFARKFGKRRREDDFDIHSIKRRAVSPSLSVHNSPISTGASGASREGTAATHSSAAPPAAGAGAASGPGVAVAGANVGAAGGWGQPPRALVREGSSSGAASGDNLAGQGSMLGRSNSGGSAGSLGGGVATGAAGAGGVGGVPGMPTKRVGLQGMMDTNEGIMNMSIE